MEARTVGHQADVGGERNRESSAGRSSVDRGDHWDLKLLQLGRKAVAQLRGGQTGLAFGRDTLLAVGEVGARAKSATRAGDH